MQCSSCNPTGDRYIDMLIKEILVSLSHLSCAQIDIIIQAPLFSFECANWAKLHDIFDKALKNKYQQNLNHSAFQYFFCKTAFFSFNHKRGLNILGSGPRIMTRLCPLWPGPICALSIVQSGLERYLVCSNHAAAVLWGIERQVNWLQITIKHDREWVIWVGRTVTAGITV